jgi:hypothetical protein
MGRGRGREHGREPRDPSITTTVVAVYSPPRVDCPSVTYVAEVTEEVAEWGWVQDATLSTGDVYIQSLVGG